MRKGTREEYEKPGLEPLGDTGGELPEGDLTGVTGGKVGSDNCAGGSQNTLGCGYGDGASTGCYTGHNANSHP